MADAKSLSKSEHVRRYFAEHPKSTSQQAAEALQAQGVEVTARYAAQIRSKAKVGSRSFDDREKQRSRRESRLSRTKVGGTATRPAATMTAKPPVAASRPQRSSGQRAAAPEGVGGESLMLAAELIQKTGSVEAARRAIDAAARVAALIAGSK